MGEGLPVRGSMGFYGNGWVSDDDVSLSQETCRTSCREYEQHVINLDLIDNALKHSEFIYNNNNHRLYCTLDTILLIVLQLLICIFVHNSSK